jgi:3-hydroxyisobutyrate dehydrogenase-like beta-hydroxyacid dehydrogenase
MGKGMASNLIKAGYTVTVWNRSANKMEELVKSGANAALSPADVVRASQVTFGMLADPAAAVDVVFSEKGVLAGVGSGKVYIDCSTVDEDCSKKIGAAIVKSGARFMEAPVSGSKGPAESGTLIFLCAGDRSVFDETVPILNKMGKASHFLGEVGAAARMKLVVNMVMGSTLCALAEGVNLADHAGLSSASLLEILGQGAMASPLFAAKGKAMLAHEYPVNFPLKHQEKDMRLALSLAEQVGVAPTTNVAAAAHSHFKLASNKGLGDSDFSAVREVGGKVDAKPGIFSSQ